MGYNAFRRRRGMQYCAPPPAYWKLTVQTTGVSQDFAVNIYAGSSVSITIDWDDGSAPVLYNTTGIKTCTYAAAGTYYPKISGSIVDGYIRIGIDADTRGRLKATAPIGGVTGLKSFSQAFYGCTGLKSLPVDLFRYNTLVSTEGFSRTFYGCTGLTSLPVDLFKYNTLVSTQGFYRTFYGCNKLTLNPWIFYASGEESTRFASPVPTPDFAGCFQLTGAFTGAKGTAPALWDCTFNGAPTTTNCFTGHSAASVDNYGDIPTAWGGA